MKKNKKKNVSKLKELLIEYDNLSKEIDDEGISKEYQKLIDELFCKIVKENNYENRTKKKMGILHKT